MISNVRNPRFFNATHTAILLDIDLDGHGAKTFLALPTDVEAHGRELYLAAAAGAFGEVAAYVAPPPPPPIVPGSLPLWRVREALRQAGKLDAATAAVAALGNPAAVDFWASSDTIARGSATLATAAAGAAIAVDDLLVAAAAIAL